ncbi:MAG: nicotinamide-nucleotide amidohydrolase family protein, partial [Gudongella sp.]|nr:nicotinamide-nucleotide amidohydrolase family protein [Gudongella sp.]
DYGTAPGIFIRHEGKIIVLLPGPPRELKPMFDQYVTELLKGDFHIVIKSVNTIGVGESQLEDTLRKIDLNYQGFTVNTYASLGSVEIKIIGKGMDENYLNKSLEFIIEKLKAELGDYIYGFDNISIEEAVLEKLNEKNYKIAVAESCTGGEIARRITRVAGASQAFCLGVVAYSNNSKVNELYVSEDSLKNYGAVSSEIAYEMAKGILSKGGYDIAVSTTGFAGPTAGEGKKAGLVYICIMDRDRHLTLERVFTGDRNTVQERATNLALSELYKFLNYTLTE